MLFCAAFWSGHIEQPFRNRRTSIRGICVAAASHATCLAGGGDTLVRHDGFLSRFKLRLRQLLLP
jgi:hypothetical protein